VILGWLLRAVLFWIVVRAILRVLGGVVQGLQAPVRPAAPQAVPLARDPVCGTYVVPARAITERQGATLHFFCSETCRRAWLTPANR
jgi:YHS domain-containing protein